MSRQPIRSETAPARPSLAGAAQPVTAAKAPARPRPGHPARLRLVPGDGESAPEQSPIVVFVGVGDDRRSLLAAALLSHRARGRVRAVSLSATTVEPDPMVVKVLADVGIDLLSCRSWPPSRELLRSAAVVVVMGYDTRTLDESPRAEDWFIDDPTGKDPETLRYLRDAMDRRVQRLLVSLGGAGPASPAPEPR
jgi:arsenate reductase